MQTTILPKAILVMKKIIEDEFSNINTVAPDTASSYRRFITNYATSEIYHGIRNDDFIFGTWESIRDISVHFELLTRLTQHFVIYLTYELGSIEYTIDEVLAKELCSVLNVYPSTENDEHKAKYVLYDAGVETTMDLNELTLTLQNNMWFMVLLVISLIPTSSKTAIVMGG